MAPKKNYTPEQMGYAMEAVHKGEKISVAAKKFGVPRITLRNKVKGISPAVCSMGPATYLSKVEEEVLVHWVLLMNEKHIPITKEELLDSVQKIIVDKKQETPFKDNKPGKKWYELFLKRHPIIAERTAENLCRARDNVTQDDIEKWFKEVEDYLKDNDLMSVLEEPERVFNTDESAFFLSPKPGKVLAKKGEKHVYSSSGDDKENLTVLVTGNAAGQLAPTMVIYPYERVPAAINSSFPSDWALGRSPSGWMYGATFYEYMANIFHPWLLQQNIKRPILFFLDGHKSHMTMHLSDFCVENQITIIALNPNSTHILQPMDIAVFRPLKVLWRKAVAKWKLNSGHNLKRENFAPVLKPALEAISPGTIKNGFRCGGICPFGSSYIDLSKFKSKQAMSKQTYDLCFLQHLENEIKTKFNSDKLKLFRELYYLVRSQVEDRLPIEDSALYVIWASAKHSSTSTRDAIQETTTSSNTADRSIQAQSGSTSTASDNLQENTPEVPVLRDTSTTSEGLIRIPSSSISTAIQNSHTGDKNALTKERSETEVIENLVNFQNNLEFPDSHVDDVPDNLTPDVLTTIHTVNMPTVVNVSDQIISAQTSTQRSDIDFDKDVSENSNENSSGCFNKVPVSLTQIVSSTHPCVIASAVIQPEIPLKNSHQNPINNEKTPIKISFTCIAGLAGPSKSQNNTNTSNQVIPSPFKRNLFWPEEEECKRGKKRKREKIPFVVTSDAWREYHKKKENEKKFKLEEKQRKSKEREEKKLLKENNARNKKKVKKPKVVKKAEKQSDSSDDTDTEINYAESDASDESGLYNQDTLQDSGSSETEDVPLSKICFQKKLFKGAYVIVKYEGEYFPGIIESVHNSAFEVSTMTFSTGNTFRWPEKPDKIWYKQTDIIEVIDAPILCNKRGFFAVKEMKGELGVYFEGDMVLTSAQKNDVRMASTNRNGLRNATSRWPNNTVVYHIEDDFDEDEVKMIEDGMADISNKSCIKFIPRKSDSEHAVIIKGTASGCFSSVGYNSPGEDEEVNQVLNLGKRCFRHGTVVHEMLHTLGFYHMQSTYNRDDYVQIVWENIQQGVEYNFNKYNNNTITDYGVPYDYGSVMHYPEKAFSKNGNKTIIPLKEGVKIGQRNGLSESDVHKLNLMYCDESQTYALMHNCD